MYLRRGRPPAAAALAVVLLAGCTADGAPTTSTPPTSSATSTAPSSPTTLPTTPATTSATDLEALLPPPPKAFRSGSQAWAANSGPFTAAGFLTSLSTSPDLDAALLAASGFLRGYHGYTAADKDVRWLHIYVYEVATPAGARTLRDGFAKQNSLESAFDTGLEGVLTGLDHADPATSDGATTPATDTAQVIGATGRYAYDIIVAATDGSTDVQAVATSLARAQDALLASAG